MNSESPDAINKHLVAGTYIVGHNWLIDMEPLMIILEMGIRWNFTYSLHTLINPGK